MDFLMDFLGIFANNYAVKLITTFLLSMSPVLELRGSILFGMTVGVEIDSWIVFLVSIIGNMIPVPFIILFIRKIFTWIRNHMKWLGKLVERMEKKGNDPKHQERVKKYGFWGLFMFVAIPLPGTGAWTSALIAAMLNMRLKHSLPGIFVGVICAGILVSLAYAGALGVVGNFVK